MARVEFDSIDFDYLSNDIDAINTKIDNLKSKVSTNFVEERENDLFVSGFNNIIKFLEDERDRLLKIKESIRDYKETMGDIESRYKDEFNDVHLPVISYRDVVNRTSPVSESTTEEEVVYATPVTTEETNTSSNESVSATPVYTQSYSSGSYSGNVSYNNDQSVTSTTTNENNYNTNTTNNNSTSSTVNSVPSAPTSTEKEKKDDSNLGTIAAIAAGVGVAGLAGVGVATAVKKKKENDEDDDNVSEGYYEED
jgi:hypothetical protein